MSVSAQDVKALRDRTGAGMMECKAALQEADGDAEKAIELLRVRGQAKAAKRGERQAAEGTIGHYVHFNGRVGALVEVDCETDFVAKQRGVPELRARGRGACRVGRPALGLRGGRARGRARSASGRSSSSRPTQSKPAEVRKKIAEGRLRKWLEEVVLLNQPHVNADRHEGRTIEQLRADLSSKTGENVVIRRFARFQVGE